MTTFVSPEAQVAAVESLIRRITPAVAERFELRIIAPENGADVFEIDARDGRVRLSGSGGVALASAFHWYLKYCCEAHVSWSGVQLDLPDPLPATPGPIRKVSPHRYRYYLNFCTFSYSMPWWTWERWERELDWMALHGINLPLAAIGHEAVLIGALGALGLNEEEVRTWLAGPAYRAWGLMGNIDSWGGPVSRAWVDAQCALQQRIVKRMRELGMQPVFPGFAGHVPEALRRVFPHAGILQLPGWYGYPGVHFLDPRDPLFKVLAREIVEQQRRLYGPGEFYATDLLHELEMPEGGHFDLKAVAQGILEGMRAANPEAIWVMQSWSLRPDVLCELPANRVLVLDLFCDSEPKWTQTDAFHGKPWLWCMLHNFGGRTGMSGRLDRIASDLPNALRHPKRGDLRGIGIAPEGIEQNPVIYDFMAEMAWRTESPDLAGWITRYTRRRYGGDAAEARKCWEILARTVYRGPTAYGPVESVICARPSTNVQRVSSNGSRERYYDPAELREAWRLLYQCRDCFARRETYRYDLVDLGRQVLAESAEPLYAAAIQAWKRADGAALREAANRFLQLIDDLDDLLATNEHFLLGKWVSAARAAAPTEEERALFEWNARTQVTLWSSPEIPEFHDYANKQWSGLLKSFYRGRWERFFQALEKSVASPGSFDEPGFRKELLAWEEEWARRRTEHPDRPVGDCIEVTGRLIEKHGGAVDPAR